MFRAPLCPLSEAQEYYTVVAACGISCCKNVKIILLVFVEFEFSVLSVVCYLGLLLGVSNAIRSAIKTSVASSWHFIPTY